MTRYIRSYGLDPSLRHGVLVQSLFGFRSNNRPILTSVDVVFEWKARHPLALTEDSEPSDIYDLASNMAQSISSPGVPLAIDFDDRSVYWTRRPGQVLKLYFMLGYFISSVHSYGTPVVLIKPDQVRKSLGVSRRAEKDLVWGAFQGRVELSSLAKIQCSRSEDIRDAVMLSYVLSCTREMNNAHPAQAPLPISGASASDAIQTIDETTSTG